MYETIIVGVGGSKYAEEAFKVGIDLSKQYGAKLIITAVYVNDAYLTYTFTYPPPIPPED